MDRDGTFSEFELDQFGIKVKGKDKYARADAVGSAEETLNTKVVTKKRRGVVFKKRVKGDGTGALKVSMHIPYEIYNDIYGMNIEGLIKGVKSYGTQSKHPEFAIVAHVVDEDDVGKYKAYPNCILESGVSRKIENGGEEVAEIELEIALQPDETGQCMYEALEDKLDADVAKKWMEEWKPELMKATSSSTETETPSDEGTTDPEEITDPETTSE